MNGVSGPVTDIDLIPSLSWKAEKSKSFTNHQGSPFEALYVALYCASYSQATAPWKELPTSQERLLCFDWLIHILQGLNLNGYNFVRLSCGANEWCLKLWKPNTTCESGVVWRPDAVASSSCRKHSHLVGHYTEACNTRHGCHIHEASTSC
jgi:hypothetical protein